MSEQEKLAILKAMLEGRIGYDDALNALNVPPGHMAGAPPANPAAVPMQMRMGSADPRVLEVAVDRRPMTAEERLVELQRQYRATDATRAVPRGPQTGPHPDNVSASIQDPALPGGGAPLAAVIRALGSSGVPVPGMAGVGIQMSQDDPGLPTYLLRPGVMRTMSRAGGR